MPWRPGPSSSPVISSEIDPAGGPWSRDEACSGHGEGGDGGLHVGGAAAIEDAALDLGAEGIGGPAGRIAHRHDIRMACETEIGLRRSEARIEVVDALEMMAPGAEAQRIQCVRQQILRPVMAGIHRRLADQRLRERHRVIEKLGCMVHGQGV